jgi:tRNA(Ile)-lysidine synthase
LGDDGELTLEVMEREEKSTDFPQNQYTKWFDYDKIKQSLVLRTRNVGDYLTIAGNDGRIIHKSVKDYMLTEKIPREKRDRLYLLAEGEHVIWLIGYRISEHYKISGDTKRILQVQFNRKSLER